MTNRAILDQLYFPTTEGPRWVRVVVHLAVAGVVFALLTCLAVEGENSLLWKTSLEVGCFALIESVNHVLLRAARHERYRPKIWAVKLAAYTSVITIGVVVYFQFGGRDWHFVWPPHLYGRSVFMMIGFSFVCGWFYAVASLSPDFSFLSPGTRRKQAA